MVKGYLKSNDGIFQLAPKVTTVGREGCDLIIQSAGVDYQHAVIEYSDQEECFVLQDLNSSQGTYVNDCRVQNAAVRLAPADVIRFGYGGFPYELEIENSQQHSYPPVHQRPAWTQPLTVITDPVPPQVVLQDGLPQLKSVISSTTSHWGNPSSQQPLPRPPTTTMRGRPSSAGAQRRPEMGRLQQVPQTYGGSPPTMQRTVTGWVSNNQMSQRAYGAQPQPQAVDIMALQDKQLQGQEQRILRLTEELKRMNMYESECVRKDTMIQQLREEIGDLQGRLRRMETGQVSQSTTDQEMTQKLVYLETELSRKEMEMQGLREKVNQLQTEQRSSPPSRQEMNDRTLELNSLRAELERVKKDKNITAGLVTQMQRDMASKDTTISRFSREIENLKKEVQQKEANAASLQSKFRKTQETKQADADIDAKERELATLKLKLKHSDNRIQEQSDLIASLKKEMESAGTKSKDSEESMKKVQVELDQSKAKYLDMERAERLVRVDLEQASKRLERFRNRVLQVAFSTPGIKAPDKEISDDELIDTLKKIVDERTELTKKVQELKEQVSSQSTLKKDIVENSKKVKQHMNESLARLKEKGFHCSKLKQEIDLTQVLGQMEYVAWAKDVYKDALSHLLVWQGDIESALEAADINIKVSDEAPGAHIACIFSRFKAAEAEKEELRKKFESMEEQHKSDTENALSQLRAELEDRSTDSIEKARLESEEKLNRAIDEIRALEEEKRESAIEEQKAIAAQLEVDVMTLKQSLLEREEAENENKETTREALEQLEVFKKLEIELREQIAILESSAGEDNEKWAKLKAELQAKHEEATEGHKEQIKQHSVTICAMEERLNKVVKKNKDYQSDISTLKKTINELEVRIRQRPTAPPKPKVIVQKPAVDVVALEQLTVQLRRDNAQLQQQITEQQDVILGLRKDLAGASARLTDMTGELSEAQKEDLERKATLIRQQDTELVELRQQMVKLSQIIDNQAAEVKELNNDLSKQRMQLNKFKNITNEKDSKLQVLEQEMAKDKSTIKKNLTLMEEEGRITSELTSLGAQCRGERHEQVIARQREALTELRGRIKSLELSSPPLPTQDQALQQVVMLKKELSELRASQAASESAQHALSELSGSTLAQQISKARGFDAGARADAEVERSAHRETMEAMELSENSYLSLLRSMASTLELDEIHGLRSMAHIPKDERARLAKEREHACELMASRIKVLKERILRKDELLQGYERDLAKLRQAEKLAEAKDAQVESLSTDVRSRTEESQYLRESLMRTKDKLEQEKRLNTAIKSKKTYHLENEGVNRNGWPKHRCPPEDVMGKQAAKKKVYNEKLKRKNYEIKTLKGELGDRDQALHDTRRRLVAVQTQMGDTERDHLEAPEVY